VPGLHTHTLSAKITDGILMPHSADADFQTSTAYEARLLLKRKVKLEPPRLLAETIVRMMNRALTISDDANKFKAK
jgi:hypothetical protein